MRVGIFIKREFMDKPVHENDHGPYVYLIFSLVNFIEAVIGAGIAVSYWEWTVLAKVGHITIAASVGWNSLWIWLTYEMATMISEEPFGPTEDEISAFYLGAWF